MDEEEKGQEQQCDEISHEVSGESAALVASAQPPMAHIDWSWLRKIIHLQREEKHAQYQLACLSTLGGGYFLCNKHEVALGLAASLFMLGTKLHNTALIVRSLVYVGVNLKLMGHTDMAERVFQEAFLRAKGSKQLNETVLSSQQWLEDFEAGLQAKAEPEV